jgi:hypothetical protein
MLGSMAQATGELRHDKFTGEWCIRPSFYDINKVAVQALVKTMGGDVEQYVSISAGVIADTNDFKETTVADIYNYFDKALAELGGLA